MIVTCKVIEDLLPLYADGICSDDTKTVVEHHTAECADCRKKLEDMTSETIEMKKRGTDKPSPENPFKKLRRHYTRLVVCTLLICAAVLIPSAMIFRLYVDEETNRGISFSSIAVSCELKEFGNMFKRGEYRKALGSVALYYQEDYTDAEIAVFKDMFAADLDEYFKRFPIKKVRVEADDGKCESGYVVLYLDADKYKGTGQEPALHLYFEVRKTDFNSYAMTLGGVGVWMFPDSDNYDRELNAALPPLTLLQNDRAEYIFQEFRKEYTHMFLFLFTTAETLSADGQIYRDDITKNEVISSVYAHKLKELFSDYSYIGCKSESMTYVRENILDYPSYFSQPTVITMSTADGNEFTVKFDAPLLNDGGITHLKNVSYSDNTPEDFKTQFEDIFVNDAPVYDQYKDPKLNEGKFYLNGSSESCYFEVKDGKMHLVIENEKQAQELYEVHMEEQKQSSEAYAAEMGFASNGTFEKWDYDDWYSFTINGLEEPEAYDIHPTAVGMRILFNITYDSNGLKFYESMDYKDSDNIIYRGCVFTRVD